MRHWLGLACLLLSVGTMLGLGFIPIHLQQNVEASFLQQAPSQRLLLYFGPVYCGSQCPTVFHNLSQIYAEHLSEFEQNDIRIGFVNLEPDPGGTQASFFAERFHPQFLGFGISTEEMQSVLQAFHITYQKDFKNGFNHSGYLYLLERNQGQWSIRKMFDSRQLDSLWEKIAL